MQRLCRFLLLAASISMLSAQTSGLRVDGVTITDPGIYTVQVMKDIPDPNLAQGVGHTVRDITLVSRTTTVPARLGTRFGFHFMLMGAPNGAKVQLKFVNRFPDPGLVNPSSGETTHIEEFSNSVTVGYNGYKGWSFDHDYELVPGKWTFEIWYGDRKLAEQSFNVVAVQ